MNDLDSAQETLLSSEEERSETDTHREMERLYEETFQRIEEGTVVRGKVVKIIPEGAVIDIGYKSEGIVPLEEFQPEERERLAPGVEVDIYLEEREDPEGNVVLSKEKADKIKIWEHLAQAYATQGVVEGRVTARIKGGLMVDLGGVRGFLPGSQVDLRPVRNFEALIGQTFQMRILKMNPRRGNIVLSRRVLLEEERNRKKAETLAKLQEGMLIQGVVKNITEYGAFIDLGGVDGLLHITDMSWGRVSHPSEMLMIGDTVEVVVLKFDRQSEKVSLGLKQKTPDPWTLVEEKYPVGSRVRGKVVSLTDYGAFVELEPGVEGLVHVSEMSWTQKIRHPSKVVSVGDTVETVVLNVDKDNKRISLGMKQTEPNPWDLIVEKYPVGTRIEGKVRNLTEFGAFVGLEEGVDGLIHVSDFSWVKHIKHPSEVLKKGQKVEAVVLSVDREKERISLGIKQLTPDPWQKEIPERFRVGDAVEGKVIKVTDFGIFVELEGGVEGLIYASEIVREAKDAQPKVGDTLAARIVKVDPVERKIGLSMKAYQRGLEREEVAEYMRNQEKVSNNLGDLLQEKGKAPKA